MRHGHRYGLGTKLGRRADRALRVGSDVHAAGVGSPVRVDTIAGRVRELTVSQPVVRQVHTPLGRAVLEGVATLARLLAIRRLARLDVVGAALGGHEPPTLALTLVLGGLAVPRLCRLGLVRHRAVDQLLATDGRAALLDKGVGRALATRQSHELLLIHVIRQHAEVLLEATQGRHVGTDAQTRADVLALDGLQVVHLVRDILAVVQVVDGLTEREAVRLGVKVTKGGHLALGAHLEPLEGPALSAAHLHLSILLSKVGIRLNEIPTRNLVRRFCWNSGCRGGVGTEALTGKHKTDHCHQGERVHITFSLGFL